MKRSPGAVWKAAWKLNVTGGEDSGSLGGFSGPSHRVRPGLASLSRSPSAQEPSSFPGKDTNTPNSAALLPPRRFHTRPGPGRLGREGFKVQVSQRVVEPLGLLTIPVQWEWLCKRSPGCGEGLGKAQPWEKTAPPRKQASESQRVSLDHKRRCESFTRVIIRSDDKEVILCNR